MRRPLLFLVLPALAVALVVPAAPAAAATEADRVHAAEWALFHHINAERARAGRRSLIPDGELGAVARDWSRQIADRHRLSHRPDLARRAEDVRRWRRLGENVGRGDHIDAIHRAFMGSGGHRANVYGRYDRVGIGVVEAHGQTWVTVNFLAAR